MTTPAVSLKGVTFAYEERPVLKDLDLTLERGEFVSVVGPNGSGKTTLFRLLLGLLKPTSGQVQVFGMNPAEARRRIGYVPQHFGFDVKFPIRVIDVVRTGCLGRGSKIRAREALRSVGLANLRGEQFANLSGGQRQRVLIARALASDPEMLLLDEPVANVDAVAAEEILDLFDSFREKMTVLLITHDVAVVSRFLDKILCVNCHAHIHPATEKIDAELMRHICGYQPSRQSGGSA